MFTQRVQTYAANTYGVITLPNLYNECLTYHKWRIWKSGRRNLAPAVFVYLTFLIDEIEQLDNIQLYNLKNLISSIRNIK